MFCSQCGNRLADTHRFCATCGAPADSVNAPAAVREAPAVPSPAPPTSLTANNLLNTLQGEMSVGQRVSGSSAILALLLFFMPWVDVSCVGVSRTMSGFDIAVNGSLLLWLVPIGMVVTLIIVYRTTLAIPKTPDTPALQNTLITAGFVGTAIVLPTYLSARSQVRRDPIFGEIADAMLSIRFSGILVVIATTASSFGGIMHRNKGRPQPAPALSSTPSDAEQP